MSEKPRPYFEKLKLGEINRKSFQFLIDQVDRERALLVRGSDGNFKIIGILDIIEVAESGILVVRSSELKINPENFRETYEIPFAQMDSVEIFQGEGGLYEL